jgi:hypothetical protein
VVSNTASSGSNSGVKTAEFQEDISKDNESGKDLMQEVLARPRKAGGIEDQGMNRINGIVIGVLSDPGGEGPPSVYYPGIPNDEPVAAISTEDMTNQNRGSEVALGFVDGNPVLPIILGLIHKTGDQERSSGHEPEMAQTIDVRIDGDKLTLSADKEIVLKCGKSSITLTRAGKVIVKGAYVSNHATGVNRIKGGSVQIN